MWHHKLVILFLCYIFIYLYYVHRKVFSFFFYVSEMGDVKALISHQMFEAEEIATVCGFLEREKYQVLWLSNLVLDPGEDRGFLWKPQLGTKVGGNDANMCIRVCARVWRRSPWRRWLKSKNNILETSRKLWFSKSIQRESGRGRRSARWHFYESYISHVEQKLDRQAVS